MTSYFERAVFPNPQRSSGNQSSDFRSTWTKQVAVNLRHGQICSILNTISRLKTIQRFQSSNTTHDTHRTHDALPMRIQQSASTANKSVRMQTSEVSLAALAAASNSFGTSLMHGELGQQADNNSCGSHGSRHTFVDLESRDIPFRMVKQPSGPIRSLQPKSIEIDKEVAILLHLHGRVF